MSGGLERRNRLRDGRVLAVAIRVLELLEEPDTEGRHRGELEAMLPFSGASGRGVLIAAVDELERIGHLTRSEDRRSVELTAEGIAAVERSAAERLAAFDEFAEQARQEREHSSKAA